MPKVGGRRKKARTHKEIDEEYEKDLPKSFIFKRGKVPLPLSQTTMDLRKCFYPHTAMKLESTRKMSVKSYYKAAKYYNVTHLLALQRASNKNYLRIVKVGAGEMTFRIVNYCRMRDVLQHGGAPFNLGFKNALLVLNHFGQNSQIRMIGKALQQMFAPLNLSMSKPQNLRRVVSFTYVHKKKFIYFRHYKITTTQAGISHSFAKLMQKPIDLSQFKSMQDYFKQDGGQSLGNENQQRVKLQQIGPRMKLKFVGYKQKFAGEDEAAQTEQIAEGDQVDQGNQENDE